MDLKDYVRVFDNTVTEELCVNTILLFNGSKKIYKLDRPNMIQCSAVNATEESEVDNNPVWQQFQKAIVPAFTATAIQYYKQTECDKFWPSKNALEQIKILKYSAADKDFFNIHTDVGDQESSRRFLAYQVFLNDVDSGGEVEFPTLGLKIAPKRGRVLVYPSVWLYPTIDHKSFSQDVYKLTSYLHYQ